MGAREQRGEGFLIAAFVQHRQIVAGGTRVAGSKFAKRGEVAGGVVRASDGVFGACEQRQRLGVVGRGGDKALQHGDRLMRRDALEFAAHPPGQESLAVAVGGRFVIGAHITG